MDSNFFRLLARELGPAVRGWLVNKVFQPSDGVWSLELWNGRASEYLVLRAHASLGALFLSSEKPANPSQPSAQAMWLRKRLKNRKLQEPVWDWPLRRIAWALSPGEGAWLELDVRNGPALKDALDEGYTQEPAWPSLEQTLQSVREPNAWREFPQLSPPLRQVLARLHAADPDRAQAFYQQIVFGDANRVWLHADGKALPWPDAHGAAEAYDSPLEAAAAAGRPLAFGPAEQAKVGEQPGGAAARMKRIRRTLRKIDGEEQQLHTRLAQSGDASLLQSQLYKYSASERRGSVKLETPEGGETLLQLDPAKTIAENMAAMFKAGAKARRGLEALQQRREGLQKELEGLRQGTASPPPKQQPAAKRGKGKTAKAGLAALNVARFRSSDGFIILRGKNSAANHKLLSQSASSFDLWFHAQDGPGSHVVLKLNHPGQEPPRRTLEEAAALAGLKSWQAGEGKARVMCAQVANVRKVKGLALGQVLVDAVQESLTVALDPALEEKLKVV